MNNLFVLTWHVEIINNVELVYLDRYMYVKQISHPKISAIFYIQN